MDDDFMSREDPERVIEVSQSDKQMAEAQHNKWKLPKYLATIEECNAKIDAASERIGELRSPSDQIRHAVGKKKKVIDRLKQLETDIVARAHEIAEAQDDLEAMAPQWCSKAGKFVHGIGCSRK